MITSISVDGFKSLKKFNLKLKKGLNVLIGPNGAGKSNICQALGLIAAAAQNNIQDYFLSLGGARAVFTSTCPDENSQNKTNLMRLRCLGNISFTWQKEKVHLKYTYSVAIVLTESLTIKNEFFKLERLLGDKEEWRVILEAKRKRASKKIEIAIADKKLAGLFSIDIFEKNKDKTPVTLRYSFDTIFSVLPLISLFCSFITQDLAFSKAWNIDPYIAKKTTDILEPDAMQPDGRFLSNALHNMITEKHKSIHELEDFMGHILPRFSSIETKSFKDDLKRTFSITDTNGIECYASSLSDGTIKALALLVGVFTKPGSILIVEEPENFLHPWAAQSLIDFLRDQYTDGVCVLTTHSETVLNSVNPHEIIVVENQKGFTKKIKTFDKASLTKAIRISGFGAGYHYVAGSIGGVPE